MILHSFPGSPNAIKVKAVLHHLNMPFEEKIVSLPQGESFTPEFKKLNPNATIPVLVDGDLTLTQSNAIMIYLAEKAKSPLYPTDAKLRALCHQWLDWSSCEWGQHLGTVQFQRLAPHFFPGFVTNEKAVELGLEKIARFAPVLDEHLATRKFVLGDDVSLADLAIASMMVHWERAQVPLAQYTNILSWYARVSALESWQKAQPPMMANA